MREVNPHVGGRQDFNKSGYLDGKAVWVSVVEHFGWRMEDLEEQLIVKFTRDPALSQVLLAIPPAVLDQLLQDQVLFHMAKAVL